MGCAFSTHYASSCTHPQISLRTDRLRVREGSGKAAMLRQVADGTGVGAGAGAGGPGSATAGSTSKDASLAQQRVYEWKPDIGDGMVSAYCAKLGVEPDFTNYSRVKEDEPFVGTLDYIFLSKGGGEGGKSRWTVTDVERIKHRDDVKGPLPNDDEPSDHVTVRADLPLD